jgi:2-polyprenyl-3-methyl-5-hydroxy-6-metoxy-1,4-benzoquinol methylase
MATTLTDKNLRYDPVAWESVPCPFCKSEQAELYEKFGFELRFSYLRCQTCTLVYQSPRPVYDEQFTKTAYDIYVPDESNEFFDQTGLLVGGQRMVAKSNQLLAQIEGMVPKRGRILDIGCHIGLFCKTANDRGWVATGVDLSPTMVGIAKKKFGVDAHCGDWLTLGLQGKFDAIVCDHVLEHVPNPAVWLLSMKSLLSPGGVICISVPNVDSIENQVKHGLRMIGLKKPSVWEHWRTPDHLFEPNEKSLLRFIETIDLKILSAHTYSHKSFKKTGALSNLYHKRLRLGSKIRLFLGLNPSV